MMASNRAMAEWQQKVKEDERRRKQQKIHARERGEEIDSDDDDDDDDKQDDEVVADTELDDLASEDTLTGIHSSVQGPFSFHAGESASAGPVEMGRTVGLP